MSASKPRNTPLKDFRLDSLLSFPVGDGYQIWQGTMTCLNLAGQLQPGATATGLLVAGIATQSVLGASGLLPQCNVFSGIGQFTNGDSIAQADVGKLCYMSGDSAVTKGNSSQSVAGKIIAVDANGVWVNVGLTEVHS